jgi:hypothetical protein
VSFIHFNFLSFLDLQRKETASPSSSTATGNLASQTLKVSKTQPNFSSEDPKKFACVLKKRLERNRQLTGCVISE